MRLLSAFTKALSIWFTAGCYICIQSVQYALYPLYLTSKISSSVWVCIVIFNTPRTTTNLSPQSAWLCEIRQRVRLIIVWGSYRDWPYFHVVTSLFFLLPRPLRDRLHSVVYSFSSRPPGIVFLDPHRLPVVAHISARLRIDLTKSPLTDNRQNKSFFLIYCIVLSYFLISLEIFTVASLHLFFRIPLFVISWTRQKTANYCD